MVKAKVIKPFIDIKDNKKRRKLNDVIEINKERFKELRTSHRGPFVVEIKEDKSNAKSN